MDNYMSLFDTSKYSFESENNILEEKDLGICADISSVCTPEHSVAAIGAFQGCPWTNSSFEFDVISAGEKVGTKSWKWLPNAILRKGSTKSLDIETLTCVVPKMRTFIMRVTYINKETYEQNIPIQVAFRGMTKLESEWSFHAPQKHKSNLEDYKVKNGFWGAESDGTGFWISSSKDDLKLFKNAYLIEGRITIPKDSSATVYFSVSMGNSKNALKEAEMVSNDYEKYINESFNWFKCEADRIHRQLPRFSSSEPMLDNLYYRSLVTYILCRWDNPDLCAMPYFSTGSINGACMCSYLWDYCGGLMLHPVYDLEGNKKQLKAYLENDLTTSYALNPVTGGPCGPWYQVNQEKIICMVYYHVLFTGDKDFLHEKVGDKTVLEWMIYHAYVGDEGKEGNSLFDYGDKGNDHLELRREFVYNGVMPDVNARRYMNYMRVYELTKLAGKPDENLPKRALELKECLKELWNPNEKWYDFINSNGIRDTRYTVQMFKFINSPVIDENVREGLISHLNEEEFLSEFGLHSMSKLDEAYDQDDIDNGGGGICTHFTMQICAQLYEMGDEAFKLGNVYENNYDELMQSPICKSVCVSSCLESQLKCCDCVYQPYCGTCPVVNLAQEKDLFFKNQNAFRCKIYGGILDTIFEILYNEDMENIRIFNKWIGVDTYE